LSSSKDSTHFVYQALTIMGQCTNDSHADSPRADRLIRRTTRTATPSAQKAPTTSRGPTSFSSSAGCHYSGSFADALHSSAVPMGVLNPPCSQT
jgi:hypothetical protein